MTPTAKRRAVNFLILISVFLGGFVFAMCLMANGFFDPDPYPNKKESVENIWGKFPEKPEVKFLGNNHSALLLKTFNYIDPNDRIWTALKGETINGASIPKVFWSITGGPFEGEYLNASIVHDAACVRRTESWQEVHRMFYEACRCGGVGEKQAKLLYAAVYHGGPRWYPVVLANRPSDGPERIEARSEQVPELTSANLEKLKAFIESENRSLKEIEEFATEAP